MVVSPKEGGVIVYSNIFITETFALTPEFCMHFMQGNNGLLIFFDRNSEDTLPMEHTKWSSAEFGLGFLAKFYAKWFYAGVGLAATHTTAAKLISATIIDIPISQEMLNTMPTKSSWGLESTLELGLDIPCGSGQFNISSRTSFNLLNFYRFIASARNTNINLRTGNLLRTGLYMGYSFNVM